MITETMIKATILFPWLIVSLAMIGILIFQLGLIIEFRKLKSTIKDKFKN